MITLHSRFIYSLLLMRLKEIECILHLKLIATSMLIISRLYKPASNIVIISHKKLVPSMSWEVIEFFKCQSSNRYPRYPPDRVVILSRQTLSGTTLNLLDLSYLVTTCFSVQSSCAILNLPVFPGCRFLSSCHQTYKSELVSCTVYPLKVYLLFLSVHVHDIVINKARPFK